MDPIQLIWDRLLHYREELVEICEEVSDSLEENREKREAWEEWTKNWKKIWLEDRQRDEKIP